MKPRLILSLLALLTCSPVAHAELVFDISEEIISPTQTNLLITVSGSVDTDGLTLDFTNAGLSSTFEPDSVRIAMRPSTYFGGAYGYRIPSPLPQFGTNVDTLNVEESTEGSIIGFNNSWLFVPPGYVSETSLSASMTVLNQNFADFSLIAGESYSIAWAEGTTDEDRLTVNIVPEPSSILLIGTASGLLALARQKRKTLAVD